MVTRYNASINLIKNIIACVVFLVDLVHMNHRAVV